VVDLDPAESSLPFLAMLAPREVLGVVYCKAEAQRSCSPNELVVVANLL
jgi:hypothetical protein